MTVQDLIMSVIFNIGITFKNKVIFIGGQFTADFIDTSFQNGFSYVDEGNIIA